MRWRVLVAGGRGMIGSAVARRLVQAGHEVVLAGRREEAGGLRLDFTAMPPRPELVERLRGFDVVINAAGIFQAQGKQSFDAVHVKGVGALAQAAVEAGVRRFVHVSALGAGTGSALGYFASKGAAERLLLDLPAAVVVLRPSLVFSAEGASTRFFARLATAPLAPLPGGGRQPVQPVHLDDLVEAVLHAMTAATGSTRLDVVGPRPLPLREYLSILGRALGRRRPRFVAIPMRLLAPLMPLIERQGGGLASRDSLRMLEAGSTGDPAPLERLLGRSPRDPAQFVDAATAVRLRAGLRLGTALGWMRLGLAALWLGTAWVSLWGYPREGSLALLARLDLHGSWAQLALWSGALLDAGFGLATLLLPRRRRLYQAQVLLIAAYSVLISIGLPEFWLHPFAPLLKNVPIVAMIGALLLLDRTDGPGDR